MGVVLTLVFDVVRFWHRKLKEWYARKSPVELWLDLLRNAEAFEDWEEAALHLDNLLGLDLWRNNPTSKYYDYRLIHERLNSFLEANEDADVNHLVNLLRSGLVRNLGNISSPKLYNRAFAGTKYLIEEYITHVAEAVDDVTALPTTPPAVESLSRSGTANNANSSSSSSNDKGRPQTATIVSAAAATLTNQTKLDFIHDTRQAFGRSTLVFQGGAIFGLCHLGVAKALFLRGLLPRIITGTATGALIAALVAIHTEEELPAVLRGDGIDLSAFSPKAAADDGSVAKQSFASRWQTLLRRGRRFWKEGYFLDVKVLEDCVRANVGDLTFEEAYNRSKRVLNITVATAGQGGVPTLLNYLTAPNVLIWTAAVASNASSGSLYGHRETTVLCKDAQGHIVPWAPANTIDFPASSDRDKRAPRFSWTPAYEATFFRALCEAVQLGLRENHSFKAEAWDRAAAALQEKHAAYPTKNHLVNKSDNARKKFRLWRGLREDPEFLYNPNTRTVTATEEAWRSHIEKEPLSRALRGRSFEHEEFMEILYPDVIGSGGAPKRIMKPKRKGPDVIQGPEDGIEMPGTGVLDLQVDSPYRPPSQPAMPQQPRSSSSSNNNNSSSNNRPNSRPNNSSKLSSKRSSKRSRPHTT
ncbi:Lipase 4 like protein [Verticillium longisporum]|nr:Lipase 4 like protein [Verticillium longisporum]